MSHTLHTAPRDMPARWIRPGDQIAFIGHDPTRLTHAAATADQTNHYPTSWFTVTVPPVTSMVEGECWIRFRLVGDTPDLQALLVRDTAVLVTRECVEVPAEMSEAVDATDVDTPDALAAATATAPPVVSV